MTPNGLNLLWGDCRPFYLGNVVPRGFETKMTINPKIAPHNPIPLHQPFGTAGTEVTS